MAQNGKLTIAHRINTLEPSPYWKLYIDESGDFSALDKGKSRVVGILLPEGLDLAPSRVSHAVSTWDTSMRPVELKRLLDAPCGIFGITTDCVRDLGVSDWYATVQETITWVLRLLPLPKGGRPVIDIFIENRCEYKQDLDTKLLKDQLRIELKKDGRTSSINIGKVCFTPKRGHDNSQDAAGMCAQTSQKDKRNLAWADLFSYSWQRSGLRPIIYGDPTAPACIFEGKADLLDACRRTLRGDNPSAGEWLLLTSASDATDPRSLPGLTLEALSRRCRKAPEECGRYVKAMAKTLDEKNYDLRVLEYQADWLHRAGAQDMKPKHVFFWRLSQLAIFNHEGVISGTEYDGCMAELESLLERMKADSDPEIHCHAALRMAVSDTNRFDFESAVRRLGPWDPEQGGCEMGRPLWDGKICSSLGQFTAFRGDPELALLYFDKAVEHFRVHADIEEKDAARQMRQTMTYAAIAAMDIPGMSGEELARRMEDALGCSVADAAADTVMLMRNSYSHHLLVRYLTWRGTQQERNVYLASSNRWLSNMAGTGHPWPIIQYHRYLLSKNSDLKNDLREAIAPAAGDDAEKPTIKCIRLILMAAAGAINPRSKQAREIIAGLRVQLPKMTAALDLVAATEPRDETLVEKTLTFNYR